MSYRNCKQAACILALALLIVLVSGCLSGPIETPEPTIPPVTNGPSIITISEVSATADTGSAEIVWTTSQDSDSLVRYGMEPGKYTLSLGDRDYVTSHNIALSGLISGITYYYRVGSVSPDGVAAQSREYNFTTLYEAPPAPPVITGVKASPDTSSAVIEWNTDIATNSIVSYGTSPAVYQYSEVDNDSTTAHQIVLPSLLPGNKYYYTVSGVSGANMTSQSLEQSFKTPSVKSGAQVSVGELLVRIDGLEEYLSNGRYYSRAKIDIENNGAEIVSIGRVVSAVLNSNENQSTLVSLRTPDELTSLGLLLPNGKISRSLYYERVSEGPGLLYLSLSIPSGTYSFTVDVVGPEHIIPPPLNLTVEEQKAETEEHFNVTLNKFESRLELVISGRSRLLARADLTLKNNGDKPVPIRFNPTPAIVDDAGEQHSRFATSQDDELPQTTLHPGGTISGSLYFEPEIGIFTKNATLHFYINDVEYAFFIDDFN